MLSDAEGRRLRELGIGIGAEVEMLHRGTLFFKDPLAIGIGAMRVALRANHAAAFTVEEDDGAQADQTGETDQTGRRDA